jgi:hypothetical protein
VVSAYLPPGHCETSPTGVTVGRTIHPKVRESLQSALSFSYESRHQGRQNREPPLIVLITLLTD